jgi:hypothetical protein
MSDLAHELAQFMAQQQLDHSATAVQGAAYLTSDGDAAVEQRRQASSNSRLSQLVKRRRQQQETTPSQQQQQVAGWQWLPTQAQLQAAGRFDLVYSLRQHGYDAVRCYMKLQPRYSKPKQKVRSHTKAVLIVAGGCLFVPAAVA